MPPPAQLGAAAIHAALVVAASTLLIGGVELGSDLGALSVRGLLGMVALSLTLGALLGALLGGYLHLTQRLPRLVRYLCDAAVGGALVAWLFDDLGILAKWQGSTQALAELAALGCVGFGYVLALALALSRAVLAAPPRRAWLRVLLAVASLAVSAALALAAGLYSLEQYPSLDRMLHVGELVFGGLALLIALAERSPLHVPARALSVAVAGAGVASALLLSTRDDLHVLLTNRTSRPLLVSMRRLTDVDGDGYSGFFGGYDCRSFDASIHALARDVPGDGVDQDCDGNERQPVPGRATPPRREGERPSIVLITVDTLRADRLSTFGARRDTTPFLDAWARGAARFDRTYTAGGWTSLALPSLLRGLHPRRLAWTRIYETDGMNLLRAGQEPAPGERVRLGFALPLADRHPTVNELLRAGGYRTAAIINDGMTTYFRRDLNGFPGFDDYQDVDPQNGDKNTSDACLRWLEAVPQDRPFFLWTHYFGPHDPSTPHPGLRNYGDGVMDRYDIEIAYLDQELARLLARLDALAKERPLAVVVTSDHGEDFTDEERFHGLSVVEGALHVPLLVRAPGLAPGSHQGVTSVLDVMPTVLALAQLETPAGLDGVDLLAPPRSGRSVRAETWRLDRHGQLVLDLLAITDGTYKVTLDAMLLDEAAFVVEHGKERAVPFTARHEGLLSTLFAELGEDGPPRFTD